MDLADSLLEKTLALVMNHKSIYEYYSANTGKPPAKAADIFGWTAAVFIDLAIQASTPQLPVFRGASLMDELERQRQICQTLQETVFTDRSLIIAANRGPITFQSAEVGKQDIHRGSGGLVTALLGLARHVDTTWIACARTEADVSWEEGEVAVEKGRDSDMFTFVFSHRRLKPTMTTTT